MTDSNSEDCNLTEPYLFVRNRYYPGKLLHAADFTREQEYGNGKLNFLNKKLYGTGIIEGLDIFKSDEKTLHISAGSALDGVGRILMAAEDRKVPVMKIKGLAQIESEECVLGLRYHEKAIDTEFYPLEEEESRYKSSRIAETCRLHAYSMEQWRERCSGQERPEALGDFFDTCVLFEGSQVKITAVVPKLVPLGNSFQIRIVTQTTAPEPIKISCSCRIELQGARFAGCRHHYLQYQSEEQAVTGSKEKALHILPQGHMLPEETGFFPILLELKAIQVHINGVCYEEPGQHQCSIRTVTDYQKEIRNLLRMKAFGEEEDDEEKQWVPLARLSLKNAQDGSLEKILNCVETADIRLYAASPRLQELLYAVEAASGILPFMQEQDRPEPRPPYPPPPPVPRPEPPPGPEAPITEERIKELFEEKWEERVHRGVTVFQIPRHYKKGQVLYSETISHGFPGEEVILWYGRVREETNYAFWERDKKRHFVIQGREELFRNGNGRKRPALEYALEVNIEEGSFRIALTLQKKCFKRYEESEVAVSWVALKTT